MEKIHYYWVEGKSDLTKIESLLKKNDISYFVKNEYMKIRMKNEIHQQRKNVYLIFIDERYMLEAEELICNQFDCTIRTCYSKKIEYNEKDKNGIWQEIVNFGIAFLIAMLIFFTPIGYIQNACIVTVLSVIKLGILFVITVYSAKTNAYAVLMFLLIEGVSAIIISNILFQRDSLEIVYIFNFTSKNYFIFFLLIMIATIMIGALYGLRNYNNRTLGQKVSYCVMISVGYLIIMIVTIIGYANLYDNYHNEVYFKYAEKLIGVEYKINVDSAICIKEIVENTENGYLNIEGFYHKEQGTIDVDIQPYMISITEYDNDNNYVKSYYIEPGTNIIMSKDIFGTSSSSENLYFSTITYFTIGYGDIYPIADIVRMWAMQEALIAHIMTLLFVPILIIIGQTFLNKKSEIVT